MSVFDFQDQAHRRYNPLLEQWVLVSPHRNKRPWQGKSEEPDFSARPEYDPKCYLCPENTRANGEINPAYDSTYVFENDFAALVKQVPGSHSMQAQPDSGLLQTQPDSHSLQEQPAGLLQVQPDSGLLQAQPVYGECRVICFSPRHDVTLPEMPVEQIGAVVDLWCDQYIELSERYRWVQIFENKGAVMGCSNPHPHGQIWASQHVPSEPAKVGASQQKYLASQGSNLLMDYLQTELESGERIVELNPHWVALVPFWAMWPFEVLLMPRRHIRHMGDLGTDEKHALADILKRFLTRYDNLFETSFPYSMGWHQALGQDGRDADHWQLHAHFYPPLLRSATVKKFMVGYEMMAEPQRDITPEQAAEKLRQVSAEQHYRQA
jgi:UDPglucose--hexose-1-phosphate uridylyltransferase